MNKKDALDSLSRLKVAVNNFDEIYNELGGSKIAISEELKGKIEELIDYVDNNVKVKDLSDTIEMMTSKSYKDRFVAEYFQTKIRYEKLVCFLNKLKAADMVEDRDKINIDCPIWVLEKQKDIMKDLLDIYELRVAIENIELKI